MKWEIKRIKLTNKINQFYFNFVTNIVLFMFFGANVFLSESWALLKISYTVVSPNSDHSFYLAITQSKLNIFK